MSNMNSLGGNPQCCCLQRKQMQKKQKKTEAKKTNAKKRNKTEAKKKMQKSEKKTEAKKTNAHKFVLKAHAMLSVRFGKHISG